MPDDLYKEICRRPEDDTLRLAYADWLDENGDPDRAEFVRVQYMLAGHQHGGDARSGNFDARDRVSPDWAVAIDGAGREDILFAAHPEWSRSPCRACDGSGRVLGPSVYGYSREWEACDLCSGMGDLFFARKECYPGRTTMVPIYYTVAFARGFPDSVSCTLAEAFTADGTPTQWACEVVRRTPVTRFVLTDRRPDVTSNFPGWRGWYTGTHSQSIPAALFEYLEGEHPEFRDGGTAVAPFWRTDAEALGALAVAAGRLVRWHVYGSTGR